MFFNKEIVMTKKKKTRKVVMIDPPTGWKYGFPCELKEGVDFKELLKSKGYPEKDFELAEKYSRCWEDEVEVDE